MEPFPFLSLPRELRDQVYFYALDVNSRLAKGSSNPEVQSELRVRLNTIASKRGDFALHSCHELYACFGLLSCSRQVSRETRNILVLMAAKGKVLTCVLDNVMFGAEVLEPCWSWLPTPPIYIKTGVVHLYAKPEHRIAMIGDGGLAYITGVLMNMLSRYLAYGPTFQPSSIDASTIRLDLLELVMHVRWNQGSRTCHRVPIALTLVCRLLANCGLVHGKIRRIRLRIDYEEPLFGRDTCNHSREEMYDYEVLEADQAHVDKMIALAAPYGWHRP